MRYNGRHFPVQIVDCVPQFNHFRSVTFVLILVRVRVRVTYFSALGVDDMAPAVFTARRHPPQSRPPAASRVLICTSHHKCTHTHTHTHVCLAISKACAVVFSFISSVERANERERDRARERMISH